MPAVDDEESLSDVNKPFKPEMEEEKLDHLLIESAEKCESIPELGESSLSVGGERDETVSLEDKPVAVKGGEEGVLENHVSEREPEFIVEAVAEMVEMPVVVAEEGGGEITGSQGGDPSLEMKAVEGAKRVDDAEGEAVVTDAGGQTVFAESQVDSKGDELLVDPKLKMQAEEEFAPVVDSNLEMVVADSASQMDAGGDEIPVFPQLEMKAEKEFTAVVDRKMEVVDTDVVHEQQLSELQTDARGGELNAVMEGMEAGNNKPERELGDEENVEAVGGVDTESVERLTAENNAKTAVGGDQVDEEKVDVVVNDSEVGTAGKLTGVEDEKVDPGITKEIPITEVKTDGDMITEVNAYVVNVSEKEQVHESSDGIEYASGDERYEHAEDKEVVAEESLMSGTKMVKVNDDNMSMEVLSDAKLDEPLNMAEYNEDVLVKEELPAGDINPETEAGVELQLTKNAAVEEIQSMDAEAETEMGTNFIADKSPDEDGKLETEDTMSDVDEPGQDIYDSPAALQDEEDDAMVAEEETGTQDTEMETETDMAESGKTSGGKRKRGKLSKSPSISKPTAKASSRKTVGEDVCFICFDGGELVLCDRR